MLETIYTPASLVKVPDRHIRYHSFNVSAFNMTPEPISTGEWCKVMNQPLNQDSDTRHKLFYSRDEIGAFINRLNDLTNSLWRLPSESELDTAVQYNNLHVDTCYWTILADAWTNDFTERPKDGSAYPEFNHDRVSRLVKKGNGREPLARAWVTYRDRDWSLGVTMHLVNETYTRNEIEDTFKWLNASC